MSLLLVILVISCLWGRGIGGKCELGVERVVLVLGLAPPVCGDAMMVIVPLLLALQVPSHVPLHPGQSSREILHLL